MPLVVTSFAGQGQFFSFIVHNNTYTTFKVFCQARSGWIAPFLFARSDIFVSLSIAQSLLPSIAPYGTSFVVLLNDHSR